MQEPSDYRSLKKIHLLPSFLSLIFFLLVLPLTFFLALPLPTFGAVNSALNIDMPMSSAEISEVYPLNIGKPVYGLIINGMAEFQSRKSFIRVILIDASQNEHLVYESYFLIAPAGPFFITEACEETCVLPSVTPISLRVEGYKLSFTISSVSYKEGLQEAGITQVSDIPSEQARLKGEKDLLRVQQLNEQISRRGIKWIAGETSVSKMTYAQKKKLFGGKLPNLQGFEYYKGGVFEVLTDEVASSSNVSSGVPSSWDWRTAHGENWNSPVKNQGGAGNCTFFSRAATFESAINLYFNQHLNVDLSEQMEVDCITSSELPLGMNPVAYSSCQDVLSCPGKHFRVESIHGLVDEACDPYVARETSSTSAHCNYEYICRDWQNRVWKDTDFYDYAVTSEYALCPRSTIVSEDEFKKLLIKKGPLDSRYLPLGHAMMIEGYETDPTDGSTIWIYKNSWGSSWGEGGYAKIKAAFFNVNIGTAVLSPIIPPPGSSHQIACNDKDGDGYCNWGISETKPATCPVSCKPEKDCNDSDATLGSFDDNFNCLPTGISAMMFTTPVRLGGISVSGITKAFDIRFVGNNTDVYYEAIATSGKGGLFTITPFILNGLTTGTYDVFVKDKTTGIYASSHLRKKMGTITLNNGLNSAPVEWGALGNALIPGDVTNDNKIDIEDLGKTLVINNKPWTPTTDALRAYDIDCNGGISVIDVFFVVNSFTSFIVQGD